jgi:pimeloyl-ACP methyl ester carboxylesterase
MKFNLAGLRYYRVIFIEGAKEIKKQISNSKLVIMKDVGHFPYIEDQHTFNRIVRNLLTKK